MKTVLGIVLLNFIIASAHADNISKRYLLNQLGSRSSVSKSLVITTLKEYIQESEVRNVITSMALDKNVKNEVRVEAIKALSKDAPNSRTYQTLIKLFQNEDNAEIKATILKSLYIASAGSSLVQRFLQDQLANNDEASLKEAAAFGLKESSQNSRILEPLVVVANDKNLEENVRVQAIKSLFLGRMNNRVEKFLESRIADQSEALSVRMAALRLYQAVNVSNGNRDFLINVSLHDQNNLIKERALSSLKTRLNDEEIEWLNLRFHPYSGGNSIERDCLEY